MPAVGRNRRPVALRAWVQQVCAAGEGAEALIAAGRVRVDGVVRTNPASLVRPDASVVIGGPPALRGEAKLRAALEAFRAPVAGRVALDVGAAAGGFTKVLLAAGARRVYAVDAGHGQLLGSLRQDSRVVNLEATNVAALATDRVPEPIDLVTIDVSYLSLSAAAAQVNRIHFAPDAHLIGLVKPMFELRLGAPPTEPELLARALETAKAGIDAAGWRVVASIDSPVRGARGAIEMLVHGRRP
jgi:23S rRNA (cytidine1920-2'-O)/16S rRNA (cytidine1409-2'-O)-methyltransferase